MKRFFKASIFLLLTALVTTSCGETKEKQTSTNATLRLNIISEPGSLDPRKARSLVDLNISRMLQEGLTRIDKNGDASLAVAESVTISEDQRTYTFHLRDANWSNGDQVSAHDFVYAWKKSLSPNFRSDYASQLYVIKNAKAVKEGKLPSSLLGVVAPDDKTLVIKLTEPTTYFLKLISHPIFYPINGRVDRTDPTWAENSETFVSNGPFKLKTWKHNDVIEAKKNKRYWDKKLVKLDSIEMVMVPLDTEFQMFDAGDLDWAGSPYSRLPISSLESLQDQNAVSFSPALGTALIRANTKKHPLSSSAIRKALAISINRKELVEHVTQGKQVPACSYVPKSLGLAKNTYFTDGNVAEARDLFQKGMDELGIKASKFPALTLMYTSQERSHLLAQAIKEQWEKAFGVSIILKPLESKVALSELSNQNYDLAIGSWHADFDDAINFLEVFKESTSSTNNTGWENKKYASLLEKCKSIVDPNKRNHYLQISESILMEEMPVIPLYHATYSYLSKSYVKGAFINNLGFLDLKEARIER